MSVKPSQYIGCAVAQTNEDAYHLLRRLRVARFVGEQAMVRSGQVGADGFVRQLPNGERMATITLEGYSDGSDGEALLRSGWLGAETRALRFDTAQGERLSGEFWVTRYVQEGSGDALESLRVELRSEGTIALTAL